MQICRLSKLLVGLLAVAGCKKVDPNVPTQSQCHAACERLAQWRVAPGKKGYLAMMHEADERVEATEAQSKQDIALLKQQLAAGGPIWDEKAAEKLAPAARQAVISQHKWEEEQLKVQRELAIKHSGEAVAEAEKAYEEMQKKAADWEKATISDALKSCVEPCLHRPVTYAQCLMRTQAVEDAAICERM